MVGACRIARRGTNSAVGLVDQFFIRQLLVLAKAPIAAGLLVQEFREGFRQAVGQGLGHDRVVIVMLLVELAAQLIAANAAYRKSQPTAKDRTNTLRALDAAINAYVAVLRNAGADEAAAYNYEYLVRLREDIDKGRRTADLTERAEDGPAGEQGGAPPQDSNKRDLKILIPIEPGEMDKAIEPGKGTPIERKG